MKKPLLAIAGILLFLTAFSQNKKADTAKKVTYQKVGNTIPLRQEKIWPLNQRYSRQDTVAIRPPAMVKTRVKIL